MFYDFLFQPFLTSRMSTDFFVLYSKIKQTYSPSSDFVTSVKFLQTSLALEYKIFSIESDFISTVHNKKIRILFHSNRTSPQTLQSFEEVNSFKIASS